MSCEAMNGRALRMVAASRRIVRVSGLDLGDARVDVATGSG